MDYLERERRAQREMRDADRVGNRIDFLFLVVAPLGAFSAVIIAVALKACGVW